MDTPIQVDLGRIAQDLQIRRVQVESVVQLLDEGNTVPFITRYRKERTGNLNEVAIREVQLRVGYLRELAERKETILKTVEAQGKLTDELRNDIRAAETSTRLEDLYLPYKPKKKTKASDARDKGLQPLAERIWGRDESLTDLNAAAGEFLNPEKDLDSPEKVLEGVGHILAEAISELAVVREAIRRVIRKTGKIVTIKGDVPDGQGLEFRDYFAYSEPVDHIPPHRVLAINRGDKEGHLKVKLEVSRPDLERAVFSELHLEGHPQADFFARSAIDALDRLLMPSLEREVRRVLTEKAERHAVDVFARNLRSLLLQPPINKQVVMAIDPGFRTGCKVAVLDGVGNLVEQGVIHPHPPQNRRHEAKSFLKDLVGKYQVGVVAIGNGTACRETEELVAEIIAEGTRFHTQGDAPAAAEAPPAEAHAEPDPAEPDPAEPQAEAAPAETPIETIPPPEPEATEAASQGEPMGENGAASEAPVEALPPISGGAPEEGEHEQQLEPSPVMPEGTPPASASSEGHEEAASAQQADLLESTPATRNPAHEHEGEKAHGSATPADGNAPHAETPQSAEGQGGHGPTPPDHPEGQGASGGTVEAPIHESQAAHAHAHDAPPPTPAPPASEAQEHGGPTEPGDHEGVVSVESPIHESQAAHAQDPASGPDPAPAAPAASSLLAAPPRGGPPRGEHPRGEPQPPRPPRPKQPPPPPKPHHADALLAKLAYVIVNEAGASVYSASPVGREEFPDFDATTRGTISIGRRLQDPLSEMVKIEPQNIGVGLYQHDVNPKHLKDSLETVIESCVNFVGVDLNTASVPLLRHVSGLNQLTARRVVDFRKEKGPFSSREQLKEVEGVGPATFTQAAGFLKLRESANPLDRTWIHPESYETAGKVLEKLGFTPDVILDRDRLPDLHAKLNEADLPAMAQELQVGEPTLHDMFEALARPERDPRDDLPKPIFKTGILKLEDLTAGMELKGTVLNVVDFGAFVDIGLKDSGLVHISQLANRYIKSPHDVVSVGDVVTAWVMGVDGERKRVSLTMVKPGTERPRGGPGEPGAERPRGGEPRGDRGRRPQGEGRPGGGGPGGPGGDRRPAGPRPPQREGAAPQPVGAGTPGPEGPPRRPSDRPSERPGGGQTYGAAPQRGLGGGQNRGGPRPGMGGGSRPGMGGGRPAMGGPRRDDRTPAPSPALPPRPNKPAPPPPPLSKDALTGSVPLRSFGQLKQLWVARDPEPGEEGYVPPAQGGGDASGASQGPTQAEPNPEPQPESDQSGN